MDDQGSDSSDSGTERFAWENGAFLIQLVCLASALVMGLVMKHHRVHYIPEAGATLLGSTIYTDYPHELIPGKIVILSRFACCLSRSRKVSPFQVGGGMTRSRGRASSPAPAARSPTRAAGAACSGRRS